MNKSMMKKIGAILVVIVVAIILTALLVPQDFKIERKVTINAPREKVFEYLRVMENGNEWGPWSKLDPNMQVSFKGEDGTVGAVQTWSGNKEVGVGEMEIINIDENNRIDFELRFTEPMVATNSTYYITEAVGENQTEVTWGMQGRTPIPFNLMCLIMRSKVEKTFDQGLADLKSNLEK